jgi:rare lipoprotein A
VNLCSIVLFCILTFFSSSEHYTAEGKASYYADHMQGRPTASGEAYNKNDLTAAHATLPFNTKVLVTNLKNGKSVVVRVNDRMAGSRHNIIDVSRAAAGELDMIRDGSADVQVKEVKNHRPEQQD